MNEESKEHNLLPAISKIKIMKVIEMLLNASFK